ncbi:MAG: hypothetical protein AB7P94_17350 [Steroidobacteraceae bacterium]
MAGAANAGAGIGALLGLLAGRSLKRRDSERSAKAKSEAELAQIEAEQRAKVELPALIAQRLSQIQDPRERSYAANIAKAVPNPMQDPTAVLRFLGAGNLLNNLGVNQPGQNVMQQAPQQAPQKAPQQMQPFLQSPQPQRPATLPEMQQNIPQVSGASGAQYNAMINQQIEELMKDPQLQQLLLNLQNGNQNAR